VVLQELLEEDRNRERRYCGTAGTVGRGWESREAILT
jgi:hypothetical protein